MQFIKMPFLQIFTIFITIREAIGSTLKDNINYADPINNETTLLHLFSLTFNTSIDFNDTENNESNFVKTAVDNYNGSTPEIPENHNIDSLSIMWYLASFGTLVIFFLIISLSEVCCKKSLTTQPENENEVSPPPYDLFAPPTYDSLYEIKTEKHNKKTIRKKCKIFVISVFGDKHRSKVNSFQTRLEEYNRSDCR